MFEARFFIEGFCVLVVGCWPLLLVVTAAAVRNASRVSRSWGALRASSPAPALTGDLAGVGSARMAAVAA